MAITIKFDEIIKAVRTLHSATLPHTIRYNWVEWSGETFSDQNQTPFILPDYCTLFFDLSPFHLSGRESPRLVLLWIDLPIGNWAPPLSTWPHCLFKMVSFFQFFSTCCRESNPHSTGLVMRIPGKPTMIYIQYPEGITYLNSIELQHTLSMFVFNVLAQLHYWKLKQWSCRSF